MCCYLGSVWCPLLADRPNSLWQLLISSDSQAAEFHQNIWQYNCALAFTLVGMNVDFSVNLNGCGLLVFWIQGELHHPSGSLLPSPGHMPTYSQLYIPNPQHALVYWVGNNPSLHPDTMATYTHVYRHAYDVLQDVPSGTDAVNKLWVVPETDQQTLSNCRWGFNHHAWRDFNKGFSGHCPFYL